MAKEQAASEPASPTPAAKTQPPANPVRRLTLIVMAIGVILFVYGIAADRITPYTAQALVQAYLVKIAPEVGGRVIEVGVDTDQRVEAGKVLFRIEPDQYVLAVRRAEAQLETIGQSIGASTAAVATAQAKLVEAIALRENARDQTKRTFELVRKGVHSEARRTQAQATLDSAEAIVEQAEAELERAKQTLGPTGHRQSADPRGHDGPGAGQPRPPAHHRARAVGGRRHQPLARHRTGAVQGRGGNDLHRHQGSLDRGGFP